MEYPINENSKYPLIRKCVEKMFASRTKPMSEKTIEIWVEEIIMRNFSKEAIEKGTKEFIENEEYNLSLPIVLKLISGEMSYAIQHDKNCPYCEGRGWVEGLKFDKNGKYTGYTFALNCCCGSKPSANIMTMRENTNNNHKTECRDGYYLIFKTVVEKFEYIDKIYNNNGYDLGYKNID